MKILKKQHVKHLGLINIFVEFLKNQWKSIFNLTRSITKNTKLVEFQFKIIHSVYASDSYVSNFDNSVNKNCQNCAVVNNIPHQFVDCIKVKMFSEDLKHWLGVAEGRVVLLNTIDIMFGIPNGTNLRIFVYFMLNSSFMYKNSDKNLYILITF